LQIYLINYSGESIEMRRNKGKDRKGKKNDYDQESGLE